MTIKVDIFVSGAGPVGLFFAYQMAQWGHSVFIVDPKPGPTDQSRAILITSRSMEVLENRGLAADILRESFVNCGMRMFNDGVMTSQIDVCGDTPFAHNTALMQGKTEEVISQRLTEDTDCKIYWNTELVTYTQDKNGVKSTIRDLNTKQEQVIESTYIVGADGSHSRVRKDNPEWTFEGVAIQTKFVLADLTLRGDDVERLMDRMNVFFKGTNATGMVRLIPQRPTKDDSHVFRVFGNLEAYQINELDQNKVNHGVVKSETPPTLEFIQEWLNKSTAPLKFTASDIIWATHFKINERIANGFRKKRAFLIGDAAHCHSPVGGQGMNLGLQDADNLAWKMSTVLKGLSSDPEKLLDSYNEEREPQALATIQFTSSTTRVGLQGNAVVASIRNSMVSMALMLPQVRQMLYKTIMQQFITIDPKLSSIMNHISDKGLIESGHFLPETGTLRKSFIASNSSHRTHRIGRFSLRELLIENDKYTVIFVGTCLSSTIPNLHLIEKFWKDTRFKPIRRLVIQSAWHSNFMAKLPEYVLEDEASIAEESFYSEEQIDFPNSVCNRVGLYPFLNSYFAGEHPYSVVLFVRPDLYVSHAKLVKNESELDEVLQCITTLF